MCLSRGISAAIVACAAAGAALATEPPARGAAGEDARVRWVRHFAEAHRADAAENGWVLLASACSRMSGMLDGFVLASPAARERLARGDGEDGRAEPRVVLDAVLGRTPDPDGRLAAEGRRFVRGLESTHAPRELDQLARASVFIPAAESTSVLSNARLTATVAAAAARIALDDGNLPLFRQWVVRGLAVGRGASFGVGLNFATGHAITSQMLGEVRTAILAGRLDAGTAAHLLEDIQAHRLAPEPLVIRAEQLFTGAMLRKVYSEMEPVLPEWKRRNEDVLERYYTEWEHWWTLHGELARDARERMHAIEGEIEAGLPVLEPAATVLPATESLHRAILRTSAHRAGVRMMLAAEVHRARHGDYPERAEDLVPRILGALPTDPFCPDGSPMRYKRIGPDADGTRRSYLIYSVGGDGRDDGGVQHPAGNINGTLSGPRYEGSDYVINADTW